MSKNVTDDRLWAPWRLAYVTGADPPDAAPPEPLGWQSGASLDCFLCRAAAHYVEPAQADRQLLVVERGQSVLVILNRFPYNNGHLMVAPLRHVATLAEMSAEEHLEAMQFLAKLTGLLEQLLRAEGFNIGLNLGRVAGAGCPGHLHWHLVPRWAGDSNFMSALAGTRVIPQSLDALWELLRTASAQANAAVPSTTPRG